MTLASNIRDVFIKMGYKWSFRRNGERVLDTPTVDDLDSFITSTTLVMDEHDATTLECGRLFFVSDGDTKDVYVYMGTINEENNND